MLLETKQQIIVMGNKQEHFGSGDNVLGNKTENITNTTFFAPNSCLQMMSTMDIPRAISTDDSQSLRIFIQYIMDSMSKEFDKSHSIVPLYLFKHICRKLSIEPENDLYKEIVKHLADKKLIKFQTMDVCSIPKD